jgi:predicted dinucleotide-binding enzyme
MTRTLIIGTGDMAYALCHLFKNHNYKPSEHCLAVSKPGLNHQFLKSVPGFHGTTVPLVELEDAMAMSDIIILAVPASALKGLLGKHFSSMKNKILVDVTNSSVRGEDLHGMLGLTGARWIKAFNDNGAVDILLDKPFSKKSMVTTICGRNLDAVDKVKIFAEEALGFSVKIVPIHQYQEIAMHQDSFGDDWIYATYTILVLFFLAELYAILRYNVFKGYAWYHLAIQVTNKAICWTALNAFALTMLPGLLARMYDAFHHSKMKDKPKLIRFGIKIRKALGLIALWFLGIHIFMSLLLFNPKYYSKVRCQLLLFLSSKCYNERHLIPTFAVSFSSNPSLRAQN